jgi:hypothetical protein
MAKRSKTFKAGVNPVFFNNVYRLVYLLFGMGRVADRPGPAYDTVGKAGFTEEGTSGISTPTTGPQRLDES